MVAGGGMHGCQGACMVDRGCVWLPGACVVAGGMHGCQGACMVAGAHAQLPGGVHGCQGVCVVAGGHAWLPGGMHGCQGACMVARGTCMGYDEIQSMSRQYASYWNAFLLNLLSLAVQVV